MVVATRNSGKINELRRILAPTGISLVGLEAFPRVGTVEEAGASFLENALLKACAVAKATDLPALADDSGLEVDALGGAPGVRSARYAGDPGSDTRNNSKLIEALQGRGPGDRLARFRCLAAAALPDGSVIWEEGAWRGAILDVPRGAGGFGYDPLFFDPETGRTAAEMDAAEKDSRSHRGTAFRKLAKRLPEFLAAYLRD